MEVKIYSMFDRLKEHYELSDSEVSDLKSLSLKEMFAITEALESSDYQRLDELISTVRALGSGTKKAMSPTVGKIGKGAGMAGDAIKTTGAYRGTANTLNKVGQAGSYVGQQTAKGYDDYQQAKNAVKNKITGKTAAATGAVKKASGIMGNIASQIKGNIQRGMQAGQANDAVGAAQSSQRIGQGVNDLADTDIGDLDYELDQFDQDSLAKNMAPQQNPKTGQVTKNVNLKKNDALRVVDIDDNDPSAPITVATRDNKKIKIDPKTGAKVESKEKTMRANELKEAVGDFADPIYDLIDELGDSSIVLDNLIRYLDGDTIKDFVEDFRRHHDMKEGFKSDAQRKAAFANGYDPKKKKKESVNEDETDDEKKTAIYTLRMSLENLKDEIDQLADLDNTEGASGRGDLHDQLSTMDKLVSNFEAVLDRANKVVPSDLDVQGMSMEAKDNDDEDELDDEAGEVPMLDKDFDDDDELNEIKRLAGVKETTTSGSIAGTTDGFGTIAQHRSLIRRFQKQNKKK